MRTSRTGGSVSLAGLAAGAAVAAAALLQLAASTALAPEGVTEALWLLGWSAVAVAVLLTITTAVALSDWQHQPRRAVGASLALLAVALGVLAVTASLHPLFGWGSGAG